MDHNNNRFDFRKATIDDLHQLSYCASRCFEESYGGIDLPEDITAYVASAYNFETLSKEVSSTESLYYVIVETPAAEPTITPTNHNNDEDIQNVHSNVNNIIGYFRISWGDQQTDETYRQRDDTIQIQRLYIRKSYQNLKLGSQMMDIILNFILQQTQSSIAWLTVYSKNPRAVQFYQRYGFNVVGEYIFQMSSGPTIDYIMELNCDAARNAIHGAPGP